MKIENGKLIKIGYKDIVDGKFVVPPDVTIIGEKVFMGQEGLTEIVFSDNLIKIEDYAFADCINLKSIAIPDSCKDFGVGVFLDCKNLKDILFSDNIEKLPEAFLSGTAVENFTLTENIIEIGDSCFENCKNLINFNFNKKITKLPEKLFKNCDKLTTIAIPENIHTIKSEAFKGCKSLTFVNLPTTIKNMEAAAFSETGITSVKIPEGIEYLENSLFLKCYNLKEVDLPQSLKVLKNSVFAECPIKTINLPESLEEIGANCFSCCQNLVINSLPPKLKKLGKAAFYSDISLQTMVIPDSVETVGEAVFMGCYNLDSIQLPKNLKALPSSLFRECKKLKHIDIPDSVETFGDCTFMETGITSIQIPEKVSKIGEYCFLRCIYLEEITIPKLVTTLSRDLLNECIKLKNINLLGDIEVIEDGVFNNLNITEINLKCSLNSFSEKNFSNCSKIKKINFFYDGALQEIPYEGGKFWFSDNYGFKYFWTSGNVYYRFHGENIVQNMEKFRKKVDLLYPGKEYSEIYTDLMGSFRLWKMSDRFMPHGSVINVLPAEYIDNFYINNNCKRYEALLKQANIENFKNKAAFVKLCFVLGLFEKDEGVSFKAFNFIKEKIAGKLKEDRISQKFSGFNLRTGFKPKFVEFFMKNYKNTKTFLVQENENDDGSRDLMVQTFNNFNMVEKVYPHKKVNTNRRVDILNQKLVMNVVGVKQYKKIKSGNEAMALDVAKYGFAQEQFEKMQVIFEKAKAIKKEDLVISMTKDNTRKKIYYEFLEKNNPMGLIIGKITNCCQYLGGNGESCMRYGMEQPNSGFVIFKEGNNIIGQGWVWFDSKTKVLCIDSIEMPVEVIKKVRNQPELKDNMIDAIKRFAENTVNAMKTEKNIHVEKVTIGLGSNDNNQTLKKVFEERKDYFENDDDFKHLSEYDGYSDTKKGVLVLKLKGEEEFER